MDLAALASTLQGRHDAFFETLEEWVNTDSGSFNPAGVSRVADLAEKRLWNAGWQVERIEDDGLDDDGPLGDLVIGRLPGEGPNVMLIGHIDTVFEDGEAERRPFRMQDGRAYGPGVADMKSGVLAGLFAVEALQEAGVPTGNLTFVINPDEEIGSPMSGSVIHDLAQVADYALVLEGARENGDVISARKGITDFQVDLIGRAAHAGVEPERGRSAVLEAAHKTVALHDLNGRWPGVTVNVGVSNGGTRPNIVAERAHLHIDVRATHEEALAEVEAELERVFADNIIPDVEVRVEERRWHRPMEPTEGNLRVARAAIAIGAELGFAFGQSATGGASDANTTSSAGVPTLDGLGLAGGDAHAPTEWVDTASAMPRVAMLAGLIARLAQGGI